MPVAQRLFAGDLELGKRNDDHKPGSVSQLGLAWQHRHIPSTPHRRRVKRVACAVLGLIVLYYFFKNMPKDLETPRKRPSYMPDTTVRPSPPPPEVPDKQATGSTAEPKETTEAPLHDFNGPIKFYELSVTLHEASDDMMTNEYDNNVLFSAASLKSAAILLPIACEMARQKRNHVHFALMGRDDIPLDILKSVNGISKDCDIFFHDARPDFSTQSTDFRMEVSSGAAYGHVFKFIHPKATIVDGSGEEESWFLEGLGRRAVGLKGTVIELPNNTEKNLMWITRLDCSSLKAWNEVSVNIVVHAQSTASGGLIRLLESLKRADFFSSAPPRLTIELPHSIEEASRRYLQHFNWPPTSSRKTENLLTIHRRIPRQGLTPEENSVRFLESFWPPDPANNHILVLSPNVELSPLFFHYLKFAMLEYAYSLYEERSKHEEDFRQNLLGFSLVLPTVYLNDSTPFTVPLAGTKATPFLWEAPNSNAQLYLGHKWVELHDFVSRSLAAQHTLSTPTTFDEKIVSKMYPSWLEHILKLVRIRGYWTMYPNLETGHALATAHDDLYQAPEEFKAELEAESDLSEELTADPKDELSIRRADMEKSLVQSSLLDVILPSGGLLPNISEVPVLAWDGATADAIEIAARALNFSGEFRTEIGGCTKHDEWELSVGHMSAADLFCDGNPET